MGKNKLNLKITNNYEINFPNINDGLLELEEIKLRCYKKKLIKIILIGDIYSGKTCFLDYLCGRNFTTDTLETIGCDTIRLKIFISR